MRATYTDSKTTCLRLLAMAQTVTGRALGAEVELELVQQLGTLLPGSNGEGLSDEVVLELVLQFGTLLPGRR